jgi:hypothetical protein
MPIRPIYKDTVFVKFVILKYAHGKTHLQNETDNEVINVNESACPSASMSTCATGITFPSTLRMKYILTHLIQRLQIKFFLHRINRNKPKDPGRQVWHCMRLLYRRDFHIKPWFCHSFYIARHT